MVVDGPASARQGNLANEINREPAALPERDSVTAPERAGAQNTGTVSEVSPGLVRACRYLRQARGTPGGAMLSWRVEFTRPDADPKRQCKRAARARKWSAEGAVSRGF